MTHVMSVGEICLSLSGLLARLFLFLESLWLLSFEVEAFLLPFSLLEREVVEVRWRTEGRGGRFGGAGSCMIADSGTRRTVEGSARFETACVD